MKIEFKEEQKFTQWWLWLILVFVSLMPFYGIYKQLSSENISESQSTVNYVLIIVALLMLLIVVLFALMRLSTKIDSSGIEMHYFPFLKKRIFWYDIERLEVVNYGFVGGWGIRLWTKYGTVYNVKGNKGLAITLKNGKKFLIGTQKEDELKQLVKISKQK